MILSALRRKIDQIIYLWAKNIPNQRLGRYPLLKLGLLLLPLLFPFHHLQHLLLFLFLANPDPHSLSTLRFGFGFRLSLLILLPLLPLLPVLWPVLVLVFLFFRLWGFWFGR